MEADRLREEYFGESGPVPMRRSERLQPNTSGGEGGEALPPKWLDSVWVKDERGRPMRVWYIKCGELQAYYTADGARYDVTRKELADLEVPIVYVKRYWHNAITVPRCQHRAIMKSFREISSFEALPTEQQWRGWLAPLSTHMHIEFACQSCGARCKTYNRYATYVDGAEALGRATCELFGIFCQGRDVTMPAGLDYQRLNVAQNTTKDRGVLTNHLISG